MALTYLVRNLVFAKGLTDVDRVSAFGHSGFISRFSPFESFVWSHLKSVLQRWLTHHLHCHPLEFDTLLSALSPSSHAF